MNLLIILFWFSFFWFFIYKQEKEANIFNIFMICISFIGCIFFAYKYDNQLNKN